MSIDRVVNTDVIAEIGTSADMVAHQKTDRLHGP